MFERFARTARSAVAGARQEAERRGDRRIGTDHLLIALLQDQSVAQVTGVDAPAARQTADELDREALAAIGITLAGWEPGGAAPGRRVRFMTAGAKTVIGRAVAVAAAEKAPAITSRHMLLALLDQRQPDPASTLLAALPLDQAALRLRLAS